MNTHAAATCRAMHAGFLKQAEANPDHVALDFGETKSTYGTLRTLALRIANTIETCHDAAQRSIWIGMLASKTHEGYASILGIFCSGKSYMPLSCNAPISRLVDMIERSGTGMLLVDGEGVKLLGDLLAQLERQLTICLVTDGDAPVEELSGLAEKFQQHAFIGVSTAPKDVRSVSVTVQRDAPAYLLFTSGSTGRPKGVVVSHGNVRHFLDYMLDRYAFTSDDRFSQNFEFTFDLSVFDIFVALEVGACICVPSSGDKVLPKRYVNRFQLTVWFSVPSVVGAMQATRQLSSGVFSALRYSLFCGEALTAKAARLWQDAAPNAELVNLYGPTEATICCTGYTWQRSDGVLQDERIVPIGNPFAGMYAKVLDENLQLVTHGEAGELWIGGPQVALRYLDDPAETQLRFAYDDDLDVRFYRTGDRVFYDPQHDILHFIGRVDHQVKVRGYRIELGDVEQALRASSGGATAVAVPWPPEGLHDKLIAVFDADAEGIGNVEKVLADMRQLVPDYMVPAEVVRIDQLPLNPNGKIDRRMISKMLAEKQVQPTA